MRVAYPHCFIVLAYKESPFLEDCLKSLITQNEKSEILIVTSTPNDHINEYANKYQIPLIINMNNSSLSGDWNFALRKSRSKLTTLAHQDDLYHPNYSSAVLSKCRKRDNLLICFTDYDEYLDQRPRERTLLLRVKRLLVKNAFRTSDTLSSKIKKRQLLKFGCPIPAPSVTFGPAVPDSFEFDDSFKVNPDWDAWERLSKFYGTFVHIDQILMTRRIHSGSETTKALKHGLRKKEDKELFHRFWSKPISRLLSLLYSVSYQFNNTE